jgi:hypothetical protein
MTAISLTATALFALAAVTEVNADSPRGQRRISGQVQSCLDEAAKYFDYSDAIRVVHWVDKHYQKIALEAELKITTNVYSTSGNVVMRKYKTRCSTDTFGKVIDIRVDASAANAALPR